jgi:DNA-binding winged helix-turn-helix (wHTH) protein/tetratricopeptide (TPR) repeat protein
MEDKSEQLRLDPANACVWRGGEALALTPKAFAVLRHLVENPHRLVTKRELLDAVWPQTYVGDAVLKVSVLEIRKALHDRHREPRFIETVHRGGYRFLGGILIGPAPEAALLRPRGARPATDPPVLAGPPEPAASVLPPVGRAAVLGRLARLLRSAESGQRAVVFITGEAGIGKSTVVDAFLAELAAQSGDAWIARGQCLEQYGRGEAYLPVLEALSRLCREPGRERLVELLRRQAPTWLAQMPWLVASGDREALHREVLGLTKERMLREMAETIETLTAEVPLVLVLEDLHWSDFSTLDLLAALARRREPARLMLIGTYRPTDVTAGENSVQTLAQELELHRLCEEMPLPFLSEADVTQYLRLRFARDSLPPSLASVVRRRTDGNPLFVTNLVDDLVARGAIAQRDDDLVLCDDAVSAAIPDSLRAMIEKRVERLPDDDQRFLEAASVAGVEFTAAIVAGALDVDPTALEERCEQMARRGQLLLSAGLDELPDGSVTGRYRFHHALYQNVLYERATPRRRIRLHQRIGHAQEVAHGDAADALGAELAVHFENARDYVRAIHYLRVAAQRDVRRLANREALGYLSHALALAGRLPDAQGSLFRMAVLEQLGLVRRSMGDMHGAAADFAAVAEIARGRGQLDQQAKALLYLASALTWIDREQRTRVLAEAVALCDRIDDELLRAHARGYCAYWNLPILGWRDQDHAACAAAVEAARSAGDKELLSLHVGRYSYFQCLRSDYRGACRTAEEGLKLAVEAGNAFEYMACQHYRASALLHLGEWGEMLRTLRDGIATAERNGHTLWATFFRLQIAGLYLLAGAHRRALEVCEAGLEASRAAKHRDGQVFCHMLLALAARGLGDRARAAAELARLDELGQSEKHLVGWLSQMFFHHSLAEHWLADGVLDRARASAEVVCELAAAPSERTYLALGNMTLAAIALTAGDHDEAERCIGRARAVLAGVDAPLAAWRVHALGAAIVESAGRDEAATAGWQQSAAGLQRLLGSLGDENADLRESLADTALARQVLARAGGATKQDLASPAAKPVRRSRRATAGS